MNPTPVYQILQQLEILFIKYEHPPVYTIEEAKLHWDSVEGMHCKNLFLRDNKGKRHFLLCAEAHKSVDLKALGAKMGYRLGFASPRRLMQFLGLEPGSVSPFGLLNDENNSVKVLLDSEIQLAKTVNFHPNVNTATLGISPTDLEKFIRHCGHEVEYVDV